MMLNILALIAGILLILLWVKPEVESILYRRSPLYRRELRDRKELNRRKVRKYGM